MRELGMEAFVSVFDGGAIYFKVVVRTCNRCPRLILRSSDGRLAYTCSACKLIADQRRRGRLSITRRTQLSRAATHARRTEQKSRRNGATLTRKREREIRWSAETCALCGRPLAAVRGLPSSPTIDHVVPLGIGGPHSEENVRVACFDCNVRRPHDGSDL